MCIAFHRFVLELFFFSSRRRHTRSKRDWSSDVCSSDFLTGFHKRRYLHARLREELARAQRARHSLVRSGGRRVGKAGGALWGPAHGKEKQEIKMLMRHREMHERGM